ncbi:MAG TPA: response regulator [Pyrinomonadaceae bacterium]|jgi:CheY-like chemotaxis protein
MSRIILIVEDYADSRLFLKLLLEMYGYEIIEAADGREALEIVGKSFPDLILMDIAMPVMDGLTATRKIRTIRRADHIPIIAVTAHGRQFYKKAIEAGCDDLIEKPVDFDALETKIEHYLGK